MKQVFDQYDEQPADEHIDNIDEMERRAEEERVKRLQVIERLGREVAKKRDSAVKGRKQSGVERVWAEDEEYYLGIDDLNRDVATWLKPAGMTGGLTRPKEDASKRCTAFFNITSQFVDSAAARMGDILLPSGDWNFVVNPTPVADEESVVPAPEQLAAEQMPMDMQQGMPPQQPAQMPGMLQQQLHQLPAQPSRDDVVDKAEERIKDWLTECSYHTEVRKAIEDAARIGTGVIKGPVPQRSKKTMVNKMAMGVAIATEEKIVPCTTHVSPWDCFPDPSCGDDIHNGDFFWQVDRITARQLRDLRDESYIDEMIDKVLDEGPGKRCYSDGLRKQGESTEDDDRFEIWYGYLNLEMETLEEIGAEGLETEESCGCEQDDQEDKDSKHKAIPVLVTMVNDSVIKVAINPLEDGQFPYDFFPWQAVQGQPWGVGIARKGRVPQEMLNAAARALMDNAGLSAGPILILRKGAIYPANGDWTLHPRKLFIATEEADARSVADAITAINIPTMQAELTAIIDMAYKMMEESTGIMYLLQGQQGSAPDTVGGMELLNRNASAPLRRLARTFDERVTEPHINRYYAWLLQYGEDDEKSDLVIQAVGSSALVEREIQAIETQQLLAASINPAFGLDPEKTMKELLKIKRLSPEKYQIDDDKKAMMAQAPQPVAPAIEAAKIRAEAQIQATQIKEEATVQKAQIDSDRDTAYNESLARRDQMNAELRLQELELKRELAILEYANKREMTLEQVKAKLADRAMSLRVQKELALMDAHANQVANPPTEPPGRADNGQAFQE